MARRSTLLLASVPGTDFRRRDWIQPAMQKYPDGASLHDNPEAFRSECGSANRVAATPPML